MRQPCYSCIWGYRATGPIATSTSGSAFSERGDHIDGKRENRGGVFLRHDFDERLEIAQLQCVGVSTDHVVRIGEALGGFEFAFR